jgi:hypothetical protein
MNLHPGLRSAGQKGFLTLTTIFATTLFIPAHQVRGDQKKNPKNQAPPTKPIAPPPPRSALLTHESWQAAPQQPLQDGELDRLVLTELQAEKVAPAPLTTDEQFVRRINLDLAGKLPMPADVAEFVADSDPHKRAKLIDKLLDSDEYARHWARYWRDVLAARINDRRGLALARAFEDWMFGVLKKNQGWDKIVRALLTAEGDCRFDDEGKNGALFFLASHFGQDADNELAAETARVFMGIQVQCAQCHDHPSDQWKRVQFHELAGFFARLRQRPVRADNKPVGIELVSLPRGEHEMPGKEDPKKGYLTPPRFLDGKTAGANLSDRDRRRALANAVVDKRNYWFAGAFVNRIWGELMGQAFYQPVDDMGPNKQATYPGVLTRLTGAFRGSNYDIRALLRAVMNSQTYQRQIRLGETSDEHLHFAAAYPTRLRADALWDALVGVLGQFGAPQLPRPRPMGPFAFRGGLEGVFMQEFESDPSLKPDEIEGSIPQALLLMNNPQIHQKIEARGKNLLGRILTAYPDNDEALRMVYLRTLARKPTDSELDKCRHYLQKVEKRADAFEDILWALLNSTEFQTKR